MTGVRDARPEIAEMQASSALPRKSGEMLFHADWERRAFAIAVDLAQQGVIEWNEFQQQLSSAIAAAERDDPRHPSRGYYESWLAALEAILRNKRLLTEPDR